MMTCSVLLQSSCTYRISNKLAVLIYCFTYIRIHASNKHILNIQRRVPTPHAIARNIQRYAALGLTVNISEMDVRTANLPDLTIAEKDAIAEYIYHDTLAAALSEPAFTGATFWGFTDK
jgi:GH35 family endo-1,4-beta-xylanase